MRSSDVKETKIFRVNDDVSIICQWIKTRYGFKHEASYRDHSWATRKTKCCYYNRTWESFEYESVLKQALEAFSPLSEEQQKVVLEAWRTDNRKEVDAMFGSIALVAQIGNLLCDSQKEKNDWKARMLKAGLGNQGLSMPEDWETLSEEEKERRLDNVINELKK